ncbi:MAG: signal peptidase I [Syntrophales bacterium]|nr:signal peptidase I [Syntrophales bacterium]
MTGYAPKKMVYTGSSMYPVLKASDIMHVSPGEGDQIRRGDVIVFSPPGSNDMVAHRVISISDHGLITRGDNNNDADPWSLSPDRIVGRVVRARRGNRLLAIYGGTRGLLYASAVRFFCNIDSVISSFLNPAYHRLAKAGLFRRWLPDGMRMRVLSFNRSDGVEFQLLMAGHVIGRLLPGKNEWFIRRPFRLFVDEASLPQPGACIRRGEASLNDFS